MGKVEKIARKLFMQAHRCPTCHGWGLAGNTLDQGLCPTCCGTGQAREWDDATPEERPKYFTMALVEIRKPRRFRLFRRKAA